MVAELLGFPCVTVIAHMELAGEEVTVEREIERRAQVVKAALPAVLTADKGLNEPRYASLKGIMAAKKKPIDEKPATLEAPGLEILAMSLPAARAAGARGGAGHRRRAGAGAPAA